MPPSAPKNLIPLSRQGLWEAETTAARSRPWRRTRIEAAGVGRTRASQRVAAALRDSGGERRLEHRARVARVADDQRPAAASASHAGAAAWPIATRELGGDICAGNPPDPVGAEELALGNAWRSALQNCGRLRAFLSPALRRSLIARVAGQEAAALQLAAELGVDLGQGARDAVADRTGLAGDAAAVDADLDVERAVVAGRDERLAGHGLEVRAREVLVERAAR